jgi:hypothetical protein
VLFAAAFVARVVVNRRTPAKLAALSREYETPADKLAEIAELVRGL